MPKGVGYGKKKVKLSEAFKLEKLPVFSPGKVMVRDKVRSTVMKDKKAGKKK